MGGRKRTVLDRLRWTVGTSSLRLCVELNAVKLSSEGINICVFGWGRHDVGELLINDVFLINQENRFDCRWLL
jgi:hypothetical protein